MENCFRLHFNWFHNALLLFFRFHPENFVGIALSVSMKKKAAMAASIALIERRYLKNDLSSGGLLRDCILRNLFQIQKYILC